MFLTLEEFYVLFKELDSEEEQKRASALIEAVTSHLILEARKNGKDLEKMAEDRHYLNVLKSVIADIVSRTLLTSLDHEPLVQYSESAMGYSVSGTYLTPGGGIFIKRSELAKLGLKRQKIGVLEVYGNN